VKNLNLFILREKKNAQQHAIFLAK
jgi:hypothetical protein